MKAGLMVLLLSIIGKVYAQDIEKPGDTIYIHFKENSVHPNQQSEKVLDSLSVILKQDKKLGIRIISSTKDHCVECGARTWDRMKNTINSLSSNGVNANHITVLPLYNGEYNKLTIVKGTWIDLGDLNPHPGPKRKKDL